MKLSKIITKEAREFALKQIYDRTQITKSEIVELLRPHCAFDPVRLQEQALNQLVSDIVKSIRDEDGVRTTFILKDDDIVIDIETCSSLEKIARLDGQLDLTLKGLQASKRKMEHLKRKKNSQVNFPFSI